MSQPQDVNPQKFTVTSVLYNHEDFSICIGTWIPDNSIQIAMRWNDGDDGKGYPKAFGNPQWFLTSDLVAKSLLHGLLGNPDVKPQQYDSILDALHKLK